MSFFVYCLSVYWLYHLLSRADLLSRPRNWFIQTAPKWLSYPLSCAFCFTFHFGWIVGVVGLVQLSLLTLCAAPVFNMAVDLVIRGLIRWNEPPIIDSTPFNPLDHEQSK